MKCEDNLLTRSSLIVSEKAKMVGGMIQWDTFIIGKTVANGSSGTGPSGRRQITLSIIFCSYLSELIEELSEKAKHGWWQQWD